MTCLEKITVLTPNQVGGLKIIERKEVGGRELCCFVKQLQLLGKINAKAFRERETS